MKPQSQVACAPVPKSTGNSSGTSPRARRPTAPRQLISLSMKVPFAIQFTCVSPTTSGWSLVWSPPRRLRRSPRLRVLVRRNRPELLEESRALRSDRLVALLLRDRAALELRARFLRPLLPREHLPEEEVRVENVGAFLRVPGEGLARLVQLALLGVDGPELPPPQAVFGRHRQGAANLADSLLRLPRLVEGPAEIRLRHGARLVQRVACCLVQQRNRFGELVARDVQRAQVGHRLRILRPHLQRALELPATVVGTSQRIPVDEAQAVVRFRRLLELERLEIFLHRSLRIALVEQVVPELLVDLGPLRALLRRQPRARNEQQDGEGREQARNRGHRIRPLGPVLGDLLHLGRGPERGGALDQLRLVRVVEVGPARAVEDEPHALRERQRLLDRLLQVDLLQRRARVDHVLAALAECERHHHPEDRSLAERYDRGLSHLRRASDGLDHRLVRRHVQGCDAGRIGWKVRPVRVFLEHQRPWMVNSSFTLSVSAAVRLDSISGLSMVTVFPPASPSPTTSLRKLAGDALLRSPGRLLAAKRTLLVPDRRYLVISSTTCGSPALILRMNLALTKTSTSYCAEALSFSSLTSQYRLVMAAVTADGISGAGTVGAAAAAGCSTW